MNNQSSEILNNSKNKSQSNNNLESSTSFKNIKHIEKIMPYDEKEYNTSQITKNTEDEVITVYKDNFPYKKYEFDNSRNYSLSLSNNKKSNQRILSDLSFNNSLTIRSKKHNFINFNQTTIKKNTRSKTDNIIDNKYNSKSYNNSFNEGANSLTLNNHKKSRSNNNKLPYGFSIKNQEKLIKKRNNGLFDNKRAKEILNKYEYANYSSIEKGDNQESVYSTIPVIEDELINNGKNSNNNLINDRKSNNNQTSNNHNSNSDNSNKGSASKYLKNSNNDTQNNTNKTSISKYFSNSQKEDFGGSETKYLTSSEKEDKNKNSGSKYLNNNKRRKKEEGDEHLKTINTEENDDNQINTDKKNKENNILNYSREINDLNYNYQNPKN